MCLAYETFSSHSVHITGLSIIKKQNYKVKGQNVCKQLEYIMIAEGGEIP